VTPELAIIPIVTALMLAVKKIPPLDLQGRGWLLPWIAVGLAVGLSFLSAKAVSADLAFQGIVYGLAASGLYDGTLDKIKTLGGAK